MSFSTKRSVPSKKRHGGSPNPTGDLHPRRTDMSLKKEPLQKVKASSSNPLFFQGYLRELFFFRGSFQPPFFFIAEIGRAAAPGGIEAKSKEATLDDNAGKQKNHQGSFHATRFLTIFFPHPKILGRSEKSAEKNKWGNKWWLKVVVKGGEEENQRSKKMSLSTILDFGRSRLYKSNF